METLRFRFRVTLAYALLIWLTAVLVMHPNVAAQFDFSAGGNIGWEDHWHENLDGQEGEMISISFHSNAPIDFLLMDAADYPDYSRAASQGQGAFDYYDQGSRLNDTFGSYAYRFPRTGTYAFIIDNTRVPEHGAESGVNVTFFIEASTPPGPPEPLTWSSEFPILVIIAAVVVVVSTILVLLLVLLTTRKKESEGIPMIFPMRTGDSGVTQMICSRCGKLVPIGTFCSKCGERLQ